MQMHAAAQSCMPCTIRCLTTCLQAYISSPGLYLDGAQDEGAQRRLGLICHVRPDWPLRRQLRRSVCLRLRRRWRHLLWCRCRMLLLLLLLLLLTLPGLCLIWLRMLQRQGRQLGSGCRSPAAAGATGGRRLLLLLLLLLLCSRWRVLLRCCWQHCRLLRRCTRYNRGGCRAKRLRLSCCLLRCSGV